MTKDDITDLANSRVWTTEAILQYFNSIIVLRDEKYEQRFSAVESSCKSGAHNLAEVVAAQKEHVADSFELQKQAVSAALSAADRAVAKAETANEKRFESVNEFRNTLADQQRNLMPRPEAEGLLKAMNDKISDFNLRMEKHESLGTGSKNMLGYLVGAFGLLLTIISIISMIMGRK